MSIPRIFACVAVILVASFETGLTQEPVPEREGRVEIHRFDNLSGQPDDNWIGAGIAAALAADLARTRGEVRWLVRGAYQRVGDQIRITADLVRSDSGSVLTSIKVDGVLSELFGLQDRLVARVMAAIRDLGQRDRSDDVAAGVVPSLDGVAAARPARATVGATVDEVVTAPARGIIDGPPPPVAPAVIVRDQSGRVTMRAIRLDEPLRLDGQLDERVYQTIAPVTGFIQQEPNEGAPATEQTEVWVLFDSETIYVSARCWDSQPDRTVANEMRRDSYAMYGNDTFAVMLDTFYDRRNGFNFMSNPLGGLFDQTITAERTGNLDWNTVWDVQTARFDQGWILEMAIPFKSLRYGTEVGQYWGINFQRRVAWKNETSFLTPIPAALRALGSFKLSSAATLVGLEVPTSAARFEVKPYAIADLTTNLGATPRVLNRPGGTVGFDVKYGVTQGLTADFTYNTDFAQVEVDEQQVNLTRFSLFFPEKREFFLEGQGVFNFGAGYKYDPITTAFGGALSQYGGQTPVLFFSRRIGLNAGRAVPIHGGGRLTGKTGPYSIGLLNVQTGEESSTGTRATNFSAVRVKRDVLRRSAIGAMFTGRSVSAKGLGAGYAYGVDGVFSFYDNLNFNTFLAKTDTPEVRGDDLSYQAELDYSNDRLSLKVERLAVGANFNPEIGFVRRDDFRRTFVEFRYTPRPRSLRSVRRFVFIPSLDYFNDGAGLLETRLQQLLLGAEFENGDRLFAGITDNFEFLKRPFRIARDVSVPIGGYSFVNTKLVYALGEQRPVAGAITVERGGFFGGEKTSVGYNRPRVSLGAQLTVEPSLSVNYITLPEASFTSTLVSTRATYTVTPRMFVSALLQFNSSNDSLGTNIRFRWEYQPGSELFIVYTDERDTLTPRFPALENRAFVIKFNRLFRF
ncbi:MAG: DUF5916 domain-containing protein [Acidobacteriota bacterium]|nr:DUF5916 domain-containing protein [Acidobacteriota bacterium]